METQETRKGHIKPFWNEVYQYLAYHREPFNDPESIALWRSQGRIGTFEGLMADMRNPQPYWNHVFIEYFQALGWKAVATSYYKMETGNCLPTHRDLYTRYINIHNLQGKEESIYRAIIYLEDWREGHWSEYAGQSFTHWRAGDYVIWRWDYPHAAGNDGVEPRYTLQITGYK